MNRAIFSIKEDVQTTQLAIANMAVPDIAALQAAVATATTEALIDPTKRADLLFADQALKDAEALLPARARLNTQLANLQVELNVAEAADRQARIAHVDRQLEAAADEYLHCGAALVRAYRKLLNQRARSQHVPGAKTSIPAGFDFRPVVPQGWDFTTSEIMRQGMLPFETREQEAEQVAA